MLSTGHCIIKCPARYVRSSKVPAFLTRKWTFHFEIPTLGDVQAYPNATDERGQGTHYCG